MEVAGFHGFWFERSREGGTKTVPASFLFFEAKGLFLGDRRWEMEDGRWKIGEVGLTGGGGDAGWGHDCVMCQVSGVKCQPREDSGFVSGADGEGEFQSSDLKFQRRGGKKGGVRPERIRGWCRVWTGEGEFQRCDLKFQRRGRERKGEFRRSDFKFQISPRA